MKIYGVTISSRISYNTQVEADNEEEAKAKALEIWQNSDIEDLECDMEYYDTHVSDVYEED